MLRIFKSAIKFWTATMSTYDCSNVRPFSPQSPQFICYPELSPLGPRSCVGYQYHLCATEKYDKMQSRSFTSIVVFSIVAMFFS